MVHWDRARPDSRPVCQYPAAPSRERAGGAFQQELIAAAEKHLGKPYVFGGRDGRLGCLRGGKRYGVWHTGLVHRVEGRQAFVIHAKPGDKVRIEALAEIEFQALYVLRVPEDASVRKQKRKPNSAPGDSGPASQRSARP